MSEQTQEAKYEFSRNDLDVIKMYRGDEPVSEIAKKSLLILSHVFHGLHNVQSTQLKKFAWNNPYWTEYQVSTPLSTFDSDFLTNFVIMAHELAVRIEINAHSKYSVTVMFHQRQRTGDYMTRHPTIEDAVKKFRENNTPISTSKEACN